MKMKTLLQIGSLMKVTRVVRDWMMADLKAPGIFGSCERFEDLVKKISKAHQFDYFTAGAVAAYYNTDEANALCKRNVELELIPLITKEEKMELAKFFKA